CRMGDPGTEVVLPRLKNDLLDLFILLHARQLDRVTIETDERTACTVVAVSGGYPGSYEKGLAITGLDKKVPPDRIVFHAGTGADPAGGGVVTNGWRVSCVTSFAETVYEAVDKSRDVLENIYFEGIYSRRDIGYEFL